MVRAVVVLGHVGRERVERVHGADDRLGRVVVERPLLEWDGVGRAVLVGPELDLLDVERRRLELTPTG